MSTIAEWLASLGMSEYCQRFADSDVDESVLRDLTDQHLKDLGVSLGHRIRMLGAISELAGTTPATPQRAAKAEPQPRDDAERRQLTIMFCDLVGSTALSRKLDPEDLRYVIGAYHKCVAETVARFDGFVAQYMGDGALVYFGYPQAHEYDPERAVSAGLALLEAVPKLRIGEPLQVRIGAATGLVVVGDRVAGEAVERGAVGETPNLAARLQAAATPSAIVIDSTTRRLLGGLFEYSDLGDIEVKGFGKPVRAYQVLRPSAIESRFEAMRTVSTPLVGRDQELELLLRHWQQAKAGNGCVVLIAGEPGIGKSRIVETVIEQLASEPNMRMRYFCSSHHQESALYPIVKQLEQAAGFRREDTLEQRLDKLETLLQETDDRSQAVPLIADLLSIDTGARYPALNVTPQRRKEQTLEALIAQVERLAVRQPTLMVFEDVHWSDPSTRETLDLLIDRVPAMRVLVLVTSRPEFAPTWIGGPHVTLLNLNRLQPEQRAEMITHVIGGKILPEEITEQIIDRTDGVPLFIEELTKSIIESGLVSKAGNRFAMTGSAASLAIPTTLHASLQARLDRLPPAREVAQIGAAIGREFSHELISAVAAMPQHRLDYALAQLVRAELIFRRGMPPEADYTFKHALVQDVAYETLLRSRRQELHARIATVLEERFPEVMEQHPEVLAQHCAQAGLIESAIQYWGRAGRQSAARSAMIEAVAQLRKGLDLLRGLPDRPEHWRQELDFQSVLGGALVASKGIAAPETAQAYARARALCEQLGDTAALVPVLSGQISHHFGRAEYAMARQTAEDLLRLAKERGDTVGELVGNRSMGLCLHLLGGFTSAVAHFERVLTLYDPRAHQSLALVAAYDMRALALTYLSVDLLILGYANQAMSRREEALSWSRKLGHPHTLLYALSIAAMVDQLRRAEQAAAEETLAEVFSLAGEHKLPLWLSSGNIMHGQVLAARGDTADGLVHARKGMAEKMAQRTILNQPFFLSLLAQTCEKAGETGEAIDLLGKALEIADRSDERWFEAELHRLKGDWIIAHRPGEEAEAEACLHRAIAVAQKQGAKMWELRAATSLAQFRRDHGNRRAARDVLTPVYAWFTEGFETPDLREAKALLDGLR